MNLPILSVIFSATNEKNNSFFEESLERLSQLICVAPQSPIEVIVVVNKKCKETIEYIEKRFSWVNILLSSSNSRASRLNQGLKATNAKLILYQHPRSILPQEAYLYLLENGKEIPWGAFTHQFDFAHPLLAFTSWYSNQIRLKKSQIAYLDHCIFFNKNFYQSHQLFLPEVDIFEDTIFSKQLSNTHPPTLFPFSAVTSSIRFRNKGFYKQSFLNQLLKIGFKTGINHKWMNRIYEKGLALNSKYTDSSES